ncbi:MAG: uracil-DNA glycosylase [Caldilineaceae bacterium SB0675_bin_29]|uniref:Type-5 uracil-DNA glycosylase n=1 Tax=Caldilineaceae bacterium SB0675_bin_29 TaxID=2605266 RepID=A0A6B1FWJ4_9CHLR|nr:uracil-DNA glycosylase [Caldilineaceae bacterium SB0675_bin_29]
MPQKDPPGSNSTLDSLDALHKAATACRACPRLVAWREEVAATKRQAFRDWTYWGKPVPGWGDPHARLLVLGLAPGAHGANRTGRPFTGDGSGSFLYPALHRAGFATGPNSTHRGDGLELIDCYMTGVAYCVPPKNRPTAAELDNCRSWLVQELALLPHLQAVLALGKIAFDGYLRALRELGHDIPRHTFSHGAAHAFPDDLPRLYASYHVSRQNTNTGRLTAAMFDEVLTSIKSNLQHV